MKHANDGRIPDSGGYAVGHRHDGGHAHGLAGEASFATKIAGGKDRDHRLLSLFGQDDDLDAAFLDIETASAGVPCSNRA